jgi:hypothetical protein
LQPWHRPLQRAAKPVGMRKVGGGNPVAPGCHGNAREFL